MKLLLLALLLLLPFPASADEWNKDVSQFTEWTRVLKNEKFKRHPAPFTGQIKPLLLERRAYWGRFPYQPDWFNYFPHVDYWATRKEFRHNSSGDCEDVALAVMFDLLDKGVADNRMYIAVVDIGGDESHAVLVVDNKYVVDCRYKGVLDYKTFAKKVKFLYRLNRLGWKP